MKKRTQATAVAGKDGGLEINADKPKYMVGCRDQNTGRSHNIKRGGSSFEMVERFKCVGTNPTNQNSIQEEFKSCLKSGNICYHSGHDHFYSS
jgi:hypothetical protein